MTFTPAIKKIILLLILLQTGHDYLKAQTNHWETAIFPNDTWKYFVGNAEPNAFFRLPVFDDKDWILGKGGFGYGDGDDSTIIPTCYSVYLRKSFIVVDTSFISSAILSIDYDDAFIAYINGIEIARSGIVGAYPPYNTAGTDHEAKVYAGGLPEGFIVSKKNLSKALQNGVNIFSVQVHNSSIGSSDLTAIPYLSFGITNNNTYYRPAPSWLNGPVDQAVVQSNIPLIAINTINNQAIKDDGNKITAIMRVIDRGPGLLNQLTDSANNYYGNIGIEIRGSTSSTFPQKSFNLETRDTAGKNKSVKLLGLPKENDWALISNYNDKSLMRNTITHQLFRSMGHYAPGNKYCEVFVNNEYQGIYLLMEKIKQDSNRVNIAKPDAKAVSGDKLTGGYIIKNDTKDSDESAVSSDYDEQGAPNSQQVSFIPVDPKTSDLTEPQKNYLSSYLKSLEQSIYGANFKDPKKGYRSFIDTLSFIDYFLIGEISRSVDAYKKSKFFYKDLDSRGGLLHSGPTWDFDWAYKNIPEGDISKECYYGVTDGSAWAYKSLYCVHYPAFPGWIPRLMQDPAFVNAIKTRYVDLRKTILSNNSIFHTLDSIQLLLTEPQKRHFQKWDILGKVTNGSPEVDPQPTSFTGAGQQLKNWINIRLLWLDSHMPGTYQDHGTVATFNADPFHFKVFPNPVRSALYIESSQSIQSVKLFSAFGQELVSLPVHDNLVQLNLNNMNAGCYILQTRFQNGEIKSDKIIMQ
jgi:CotH kinase protein/Secretion system C-terminal sorting domain